MRSGPSHCAAPHCNAPQQNATQRNATQCNATKHDVFEPNQPIESAAKRKMWVLATDKKKSTRSLDATIETNQPTNKYRKSLHEQRPCQNDTNNRTKIMARMYNSKM
mmetsp:Transcript_29786/g.70144  ORF Transcript_29786/g.70144 Transcript_29786/m.70144 type:complete len:107 (-) Transcript_29786:211-531(-)